MHRIRVVCLLGVAAVATYLGALAAVGLLQQPRPAELAVVLGNTVTPNGQPSFRLQARLDSAVRLYRSGTVQRVLVSSGVEEPGHRDEASAMAAYLRTTGVPSKAILEDHAGTDTLETARHTATLAKPGTGVVVVSQWFHLPRAMLAMRRFGLREVSGDWPHWFEARDVYSFLREAVALPFYATRSLHRDQTKARSVNDKAGSDRTSPYLPWSTSSAAVARRKSLSDTTNRAAVSGCGCLWMSLATKAANATRLEKLLVQATRKSRLGMAANTTELPNASRTRFMKRGNSNRAASYLSPTSIVTYAPAPACRSRWTGT